MRISELIADLQATHDEHGDLRVLVDGYEGGYDDPRRIEVVSAEDGGPKSKDEASYMGRYRDDRYWSPSDGATFRAVVVPR